MGNANAIQRSCSEYLPGLDLPNRKRQLDQLTVTDTESWWTEGLTAVWMVLRAESGHKFANICSPKDIKTLRDHVHDIQTRMRRLFVDSPRSVLEHTDTPDNLLGSLDDAIQSAIKDSDSSCAASLRIQWFLVYLDMLDFWAQLGRDITSNRIQTYRMGNNAARYKDSTQAEGRMLGLNVAEKRGPYRIGRTYIVQANELSDLQDKAELRKPPTTSTTRVFHMPVDVIFDHRLQPQTRTTSPITCLCAHVPPIDVFKEDVDTEKKSPEWTDIFTAVDDLGLEVLCVPVYAPIDTREHVQTMVAALSATIKRHLTVVLCRPEGRNVEDAGPIFVDNIKTIFRNATAMGITVALTRRHRPLDAADAIARRTGKKTGFLLPCSPASMNNGRLGGNWDAGYNIREEELVAVRTTLLLGHADALPHIWSGRSLTKVRTIRVNSIPDEVDVLLNGVRQNDPDKRRWTTDRASHVFQNHSRVVVENYRGTAWVDINWASMGTIFTNRLVYDVLQRADDLVSMLNTLPTPMFSLSFNVPRDKPLELGKAPLFKASHLCLIIKDANDEVVQKNVLAIVDHLKQHTKSIYTLELELSDYDAVSVMLTVLRPDDLEAINDILKFHVTVKQATNRERVTTCLKALLPFLVHTQCVIQTHPPQLVRFLSFIQSVNREPVRSLSYYPDSPTGFEKEMLQSPA